MAQIDTSKLDPSRLTNVKIDQSTGPLLQFPDFLIVGPQRTGTTWLQNNLSDHPEIFLSTPKEIHYFNAIHPEYKGKNFTSNKLSWYCGHFQSSRINFLKKIAWSVREFGPGGFSKQHYRQFISAHIKGEATASYAVLDREQIEEIAYLNPNLKIIMFIRHPVDRAWSHARKELVRDPNRKFESVAWQEFEAMYTHHHHIKCGSYTQVIKNWQIHFSDDQVFKGFYDDISSRPDGLIQDVLRFLDVDSSSTHVNQSRARQVINPTARLHIPREHSSFLEELFKDEIKALNAKFNLDW